MTEKSHADDVETNRRRFLKTAGAMGVAGAAGCLGDGDGDSGTEAPTETPGETPTDGTSTTETSTDSPTQTATETATATPTPTPRQYSVLVLSVTEGERRDAVPAGNDALRSIGDDVAGRAGIAAFDADAVREHLTGALLWAVGHAAGSAYGTVWDAYEKETIFEDVVEPMEIGVTPDGRVVYVERTGGDFGGPSADRPSDHGAVKVVDPATGTGYPKESGLLGLTLDPDFGANGWLYLFYTTDTADGVVNRVSRFTLEGTTIDPATETVIIDIPHFGLNHQAGSLDFDSRGNLHIGTGDDTTPFESSGYAPIDERDGRRDQFDAQRSSGNTNDLRGSILRITPQDGGGYTVPEDNLFTEAHGYGDVDDSKVRSEIWAMGFRNPFTLKIDRETDVPYVADYGPDAGGWNASSF